MAADWWDLLSADVEAVCKGACPESTVWFWAEDLAKQDWEADVSNGSLVSPFIFVAEPAWTEWTDGPADSDYQQGVLRFFYMTQDNTDVLTTLRERLNAIETFALEQSDTLVALDIQRTFGTDVSAESEAAMLLNRQKVDWSAGALSMSVVIPGPNTDE